MADRKTGRIKGKIITAAVLMLSLLTVTACTESAGEMTQPDTGGVENEAADFDNEVVGLTEDKEEAEGEGEEQELSASELAKIEEDLNGIRYNGFVAAEFSSPEMIYWDEVFYNGATIDTSDLDEAAVEKEYLALTGEPELFGDLTFISQKKMKAFAELTTGLSYDDMEHPLDWIYLEDSDAFAFEHGDTNYIEVKCISGTLLNGVYDIFYQGSGYGSEDAVYELMMKANGDNYQFISNRWTPKEGREAAVEAIYQEIIQKYAKAVAEGWDADKLRENNISTLCAYASADNPGEAIGYYLNDLDDDGIDELFIGENSEDGYVRTIYELYSVKGGDWLRVFISDERDRYYMAEDYTFYNEGSSSATNSELVHYRMAGPYKMLNPIDAVIYDSELEGRNDGPYYFGRDNYWDVNVLQGITEEQYDDYRSKAENSYVDIRYTPFSASAGESEAKSEKPSKEQFLGGYSDQELCNMALDYYEFHNAYRPGKAEIDGQDGNKVTIHLYDDMGDHTATAAWYEIDRTTGKGTDTIFGNTVDLTEQGIG